MKRSYAFKGIKSLFFILILLMFASISVSAQQSCCVYTTSDGTPFDCSASDNNDVPITEADCQDAGGFYYPDQSCVELSEPGMVCEMGGCCLNNDDGTQTFQYSYGIKGSCFDAALFVPGDDDKALCTQNFVFVSGIVTLNDGSPANAEVSFTQGSGLTLQEYTTSTDNQGYYELVVPRETTFSVRVTNIENVTCFEVDTITTEFDNMENEDYELTCGGTISLCTDCYVYQFEFLADDCGDVRVTPTGNCDVDQCPSIYTDGEEVPCLTTTILCGNNAIDDDEGEECDYSVSPDEPCDNPPYIGGIKTCTSQCTWNEANCVECPTLEEGCTADLCESCSDVCAGTLLCTNEDTCADVGEELILNVDSEREEFTGFRLDWGFSGTVCSSEDVQSYTINGCQKDPDAEDCRIGEPTLIIDKLFPETVAWEHRTFEPGYPGGFCYEVIAVMNPELGIDDKTSELVCKEMSTGICDDVEIGGFVCGDNDIYECKEEGPTINQECNSNEVCVDYVSDDDTHEAECMGFEVCDYCNGPFGMFAYADLKIDDTEYKEPIQNLFPFNSIDKCSHVIAPGNNPENNPGICYADDYSIENSVIGQYKACTEISTCYDYRTKYSCDLSPCSSVAEAQNCEWEFLEGTDVEGELGIGVCRPAELVDQDCSICDDNSITGSCTQNICEMYGGTLESGKSRCYYNNIRYDEIGGDEFVVDKGICINAELVGCETYDTELECEGGQEFSVDLDYKLNEDKIGSNKINQVSNDYLEKGRCYWDETVVVEKDDFEKQGACLKDADNTRGKDLTFNAQLVSDCPDNDILCLTDFEAPNTSLLLVPDAYYSEKEINNINVEVSDNIYSSTLNEKLVTLFKNYKVEDLGGPQLGQIGPDFIRNELYPDKKKEELTFEEAGKYLLRYFSRDFAMNHEEINDIYINVIAQLAFNVDYTLTSTYSANRDKFETDLDVEVVGYEPAFGDEEFLKCTATLESVQPPQPPFTGKGDGVKFYPDLTWKYFDLEDGRYKLNVTCVDNHLQRLEKEVPIGVDGDPTITNPYPIGKKFNGTEDIHVSIKTSYEAECSYLIDQGTFVPPDNPINPNSRYYSRYTWIPFVGEEDGLIHNGTILAPQDQGMYLIYSKCVYDDENGVPVTFVGNYGDMSYHSVDKTAPELEFIDAKTGNLYVGQEDPNNAVKIEFKCSDNDVIFNGEDYSFGCDSLRICEYERPTASPCTPDIEPTSTDENTWEYTFSAPGPGLKKSVRAYINDTGGNEKIVELDLSTLRNTDFFPPEIKICDPETGIEC